MINDVNDERIEILCTYIMWGRYDRRDVLKSLRVSIYQV